MKREKYAMPIRLTKILSVMGEDIKLARLRRKLSAEQVAERAGISRPTLWQIEQGLPSVSMGYYAMVLFVLGLENNFEFLAANDEIGRKLQDAQLLTRKRAPKKTTK
jgi:transcriptional regulator with XRE-family HTH domain